MVLPDRDLRPAQPLELGPGHAGAGQERPELPDRERILGQVVPQRPRLVGGVLEELVADRVPELVVLLVIPVADRAMVDRAALEALAPMSQDWMDKIEHIEGAVRHHMFEEEGTWFLELKAKGENPERTALRFKEEYERYVGGEPNA